MTSVVFLILIILDLVLRNRNGDGFTKR